MSIHQSEVVSLQHRPIRVQCVHQSSCPQPMRWAEFRTPANSNPACVCAGMLERGEIDVALTDLSLTFPRAQVTTLQYVMKYANFSHKFLFVSFSILHYY